MASTIGFFWLITVENRHLSRIKKAYSLAYNIDGRSLFLGSDEKIAKELSTNVPLKKSGGDALMRAGDKLSDLIDTRINAIENWSDSHRLADELRIAARFHRAESGLLEASQETRS